MSKRNPSGDETKRGGASGASGSDGEASTGVGEGEGESEAGATNGASMEGTPEGADGPPSTETSQPASGGAKKTASKKPTRKDPSQKALIAMAAMLKESNEGGAQAITMADKIERATLIEIIAIQFPDDSWITEDVTRRVEAMETPVISLIVTWLALAWWNGCNFGHAEIMEALKAPLKNSPEDLAKLQAIDERIKADNEAADAAAREENES